MDMRDIACDVVLRRRASGRLRAGSGTYMRGGSIRRARRW